MNAIIDIGSNSVRLLLDRFPGTLQQKFIATTALGEGLNLSGMLGDTAISRTLEAVSEFIRQSRRAGAEGIYIFATEAVRSAKNGRIFTDAVFSDFGIEVDVISGDTEAYIGYLGCAGSFPSPALCIDIGGASIELVYGRGGDIIYKKSLPLGVLRLKDAMRDDFDKLGVFLKRAVKDFCFSSRMDFAVGIGGTATSIAAMMLRLNEYDPVKVHGYPIAYPRLQELYREILPLPDSALPAIFPTLGEKRAAVIKYGIAALTQIMEYTSLHSVTVSEFDNIEGYKMYKNI